MIGKATLFTVEEMGREEQSEFYRDITKRETRPDNVLLHFKDGVLDAVTIFAATNGDTATKST